MNSQEFKVTMERSPSRGWLYTITHPEWEGLSPSYAVAQKPTAEALRGAVETTINEHTRKEITEGFRYDFGDGHGVCRVWLSVENQANYAAYLKAVELGVESVTMKVENEDGESCYPVVKATDYANFYLSLVAHIKAQIEKGWQKKDAIDYAVLEAMAVVL